MGIADEIVHSEAENWLPAPVCEMGSYALFQPGTSEQKVYLPLTVERRAVAAGEGKNAVSASKTPLAPFRDSSSVESVVNE